MVINDIVEDIKQCKILLYADDTVKFISDKDSKIIEKALSTELNKITNRFTSKNFVLNMKKAETAFVCIEHTKSLQKQRK